MKKVIELMKDGLCGKIMTVCHIETSSYWIGNNNENKAKDGKKYFLKRRLKFEDYKHF